MLNNFKTESHCFRDYVSMFSHGPTEDTWFGEWMDGFVFVRNVNTQTQSFKLESHILKSVLWVDVFGH